MLVRLDKPHVFISDWLLHGGGKEAHDDSPRIHVIGAGQHAPAWGSGIEHVLSIHMALGSICSTQKVK